MKQEEKELLLQDLSSRFPYGVVCADKYVDKKFINKWNVLAIDGTFGNEFSQVCISNCEETYGYKTSIENVKPYLFPLSSMTEEQRKEYHNLCSVGTDECGDIIYFDTYESIDYLNKNKFDYRYLIPMGLANDATGLNIY